MIRFCFKSFKKAMDLIFTTREIDKFGVLCVTKKLDSF